MNNCSFPSNCPIFKIRKFLILIANDSLSLFRRFWSVPILVIAYSYSPPFDGNDIRWNFVIFLFTLEFLILAARLAYLIAVKFGFKINNSYKSCDEVGKKQIVLTFKPPMFCKSPIEIKIIFKSYPLKKEVMNSSKDTRVLVPNLEEKFDFDVGIAEIFENKNTDYRIWYKMDIGFYSEWSWVKYEYR
jgi:hypothetical protein